MHYSLHYEKFVFCIFTMCLLLRSSSFCHWSTSKEDLIRFTIFSSPYLFSEVSYMCTHRELCICFVTLLQGMAGNSLLDGGIYMPNALTSPSSSLEALFEWYLIENSECSFIMFWIVYFSSSQIFHIPAGPYLISQFDMITLAGG